MDALRGRCLDQLSTRIVIAGGDILEVLWSRFADFPETAGAAVVHPRACGLLRRALPSGRARPTGGVLELVPSEGPVGKRRRDGVLESTADGSSTEIDMCAMGQLHTNRHNRIPSKSFFKYREVSTSG